MLGSRYSIVFLLLLAATVGSFGCSGDKSFTAGSQVEGIPFPSHEARGLTEYLLTGTATESRSSGAVELGPALMLDGATGGFEYAVYRFNAGTNAPDSVSVLLEAPVTTGAWIGLANYDLGRWEISGPFEQQKSLVIDDTKYVSPQGNIFVVVMAASSTAQVNALSIRTINPNNEAPTASVTPDVTSGIAPLTVQFDASASGDTDGTIFEYAWDFDGNGTYEEFSDQPLVSHIFAQPGVIDVRLRVTDDQFARASTTTTITVTGGGGSTPVANVVADVTAGDAPLTVNFDGTASLGDIVDYAWDFDGDGDYDSNSDDGLATHTYTVSGSYTARVRVTDEDGDRDSDVIVITVNAAPPVAVLTVTPPDANPGTAAVLDAYSSFDPDGEIVRYEWDLDENGTFEIDTGNVGHVAYTYAATPGYHTLRLRVTDDDGATVADDFVVTTHGWRKHLFEAMSGNGTLLVLDGVPAVAYSVSARLKFLRANDDEGQSWPSPNIVDQNLSGGLGRATMTLISGNPAIAYQTQNPNEIRYVRANDSVGGSWGGPVLLVSNDQATTSMSLNVVGGVPALAYVNFSSDLHFLPANDADGASWGTPVLVDATGFPNAPRMEVANGLPAISYASSLQLKYVQAQDAAGSTWNTPLLLDNAISGNGPTFGILDGNPAVFFKNDGASGLPTMLRSLDADGSSWASPQSLDFSPGGTDCSLATVGGLPALSYAGNGGLRFIRSNSADGATWGSSTQIDTGGSESSLVEVSGMPAVVYTGSPNNLKYARLY